MLGLSLILWRLIDSVKILQRLAIFFKKEWKYPRGCVNCYDIENSYKN